VKLSDRCVQDILQLQKVYPEKRSALIPALHMAQNECGYLPLEIQEQIAILFELHASEVHGIVTFYDMFHDEPVGKHLLHVCKNASCMLRGGDEILDGLCKRLNVCPGGTSSDGEFTVIPSECLGACDLAPMMIVDEEVVGPLKESDLDALISEAKNG
jgi:NADH-quinone oxidoreductase subunit E